MINSTPDGNQPTSPFVEAFRTISHVTTAVAMMLICGGIGYGIDHYFNITLFSILGFMAGAFLGIRYLIAQTSPKKKD